MHFTKVNLFESKYKNGQQSRFSLQRFTLPIPGDNDQLDCLACRPAAGYNTYYYDSKYKKEKIVLHHTVGHLGSDLRALSKEDYHVSVAFVIARDGTIYQLHSSAHWSYHLGRKALGGNQMQSKKSIGIELSNYGYLVPQGDNLETYYSRRKGNRTDVYCSKEETEQYVHLDQPYRGHQYYASFPDAQYKSLIQLLRYLTATYNIPRTFLSEAERYETTPTVVDFKGIVSHVNFRSDKYDIGPAFDWERVILGVQKEKVLTMTLQDELIAASEAYAQAEKRFQEAQLKVWETEEGEDEPSDIELEKAEKELVATFLKLEKIKKQLSESLEDDVVEKSLDLAFTSEEEIETAYPYIRSRDIISYGIDGPKEMERDELEWEESTFERKLKE